MLQPLLWLCAGPASCRSRQISAQHLFDVAELAKEVGITSNDGPARHEIDGASSLCELVSGAIASSS